ncbi:MAG: SRPBCC family protein [Bryobacteraceae bacterium]
MSQESALRRMESDSWLPVITGGALVVYGFARRTPLGAVLAMIGGGLIMTGARKVSSKSEEDLRESGIEVIKSITIDKSPEELYRFWRQFENLTRVMSHVEDIEVTGSNTSHWTVKAPAGQTVEWDAEIIQDAPNRAIGWRSLPGASIPNEGMVEFLPGTANRGTLVKVSLYYQPPGGTLGQLAAGLFGEEPAYKSAVTYIASSS